MVEDVRDLAERNGTLATYEKNTIANVALGREGKPEEVAKLIAFLLSDESAYISGNAISIDGGWNC
jgi:NAD(P)-dependent dehydrogenase (short-subunit alcohol dehydrogenase family)